MVLVLLTLVEVLACPVVTKRKTAGTLVGRTAQRHFLGCNREHCDDVKEYWGTIMDGLFKGASEATMGTNYE